MLFEYLMDYFVHEGTGLIKNIILPINGAKRKRNKLNQHFMESFFLTFHRIV